MPQDDRRADGELITHHAHMHQQRARIVRMDQHNNPDNNNTSLRSTLLLLMSAARRALAAQTGGTSCSFVLRPIAAGPDFPHSCTVWLCGNVVAEDVR